MLNAEIKYLISSRLGFDVATLGERSVESSVRRLIEKNNFAGDHEYCVSLRHSPGKMDELIEELIVPETWFMRDPGAFEFLKGFAEDFINKTESPLRVLSAPCSTGEEPYSIAIALHQAGIGADMYEIDAVDISRNAIERARAGIYNKNSLRGLSQYFIDNYFDRENDLYKIKDKYKKSITFSRENIFDYGFSESRRPYDIVFCRNLMIYMKMDARLRLFAIIDSLQKCGGALFTGHSEVMFFNREGYKSSGKPKSFALIKCEEKPQCVSQFCPPPRNLINKKAFRKIRQDARIRRNNFDQPQKKLPVKKPQPEINDEIDISAADIRKMADQGRYDEALRKCNIYLREKSHDAEIYYLAGLINEALSNQDRAVESYNKTLYLDPGHREALVNLSLIYENRGEIRKAELLRRRAEKH